MKEDEAEDVAFSAIAFGGCCCDDDALRSDHFAHDASGGVGRGHEVRRDVELLRGELLQAAEEDIGGGVGAGGGGADPADEGSEEGIKGSGAGEGETEGGVHAAVAGDESDGHEGGDGDDGKADADHGFDEDAGDHSGTHSHEQTREDCGEKDSGAGCGEPVEIKDSGFDSGCGDRRGHSENSLMEAGDGDLHAGGGVQPLRETGHTPEDDAESKDNPGQCCTQDDLAAVGGGLERLLSYVLASGIEDAAGLPDAEESDEHAHTYDGGRDVRQPRTVKGGDKEQGDAVAGSGDEDSGPYLDHGFEAGKGPDEPKRNEDTKGSENPAHDSGEKERIEVGDAVKGDDGSAECSEGDRGCVRE